MIQIELVALWDAAFAVRRAKVDVKAELTALAAEDYQIFAADGTWVYLQREFDAAEPA